MLNLHLEKIKMSYKISAKNRKMRRILLQIFQALKFEGFNISLSLKIIIFGILLASFWLFNTWVDSYDSVIHGNAFHKLLGITGYILLLINIKIFFFIFWKKTKDIIKSFFHIHAKDSVLLLFFAGAGFIMTINSIFIIENTQIFREWILIGQWISFTLVWYTLAVFWSIFNMHTKTKTTIYVHENAHEDIENEKDKDTQNNMKLPF